MLCCAVFSRVSHVQLFVAPWTVAHQAPLSVAFSRQEYWSGLPLPIPGDLPDPGIETASLLEFIIAYLYNICICDSVLYTQTPQPVIILTVSSEVLVAQSCLTLCDPMDCSLLGPSVRGISQARILEWVATSSSRGSSQPTECTCVSGVSDISCTGRRILYY